MVGIVEIVKLSISNIKLRLKNYFVPDDKLEVKYSKKEERITFISSPKYHIAVIGVILLGALWAAIELGVIFNYDDDPQEGAWFVLGGPSLFYPTTLWAFALSVILLLFYFFSRRWITLESTSERFIIKERWVFFPRTFPRVIPKEEITLVSLKKGHVGYNYNWLLLFGWHAFLIMKDGISLLTNPNTFGFGMKNGWTYVISGIFDIIIILLIVLPGQNRLEIHTRDHLFTTTFSSTGFFDKNIERIQEILGFQEFMNTETFSPIKIEPHPSISKKDNVASIVKKTYFNRSLNGVVGVIFIIIGILSAVYHVFAGEVLQMLLIFGGSIIIIDNLKNQPLNNRNCNNTFCGIDKDNGLYLAQNQNFLGSQMKLVTNCTYDENEANTTIKPKLKRLDRYVAFFSLLILFYLGNTAGAWAVLVKAVPDLDSKWTTLNDVLSLIVIIGILLITFYPLAALVLKNEYENEYSELHYKNIGQNQELPVVQAVLQNIKDFFKKIISDKRAFILRISLVLIFYFGGIIVGITGALA